MKLSSVVAACAVLLAACEGKKKPAPAADNGGGKPVIATVNYPLAYFAERLAGDFATILFNAPADEDPAFWQPDDAEVAKYQQADLILLNGATYAKWAATTTLPFETTVDTSASFNANFIEIKNAVKHTHGKNDVAHSHAGTAFTTWMDFKQAAAQATAAADAIAEQWPDRKEAVMQKLASLQDDLTQLDHATAAVTANLKSAPVIASHPVYHYWERAYGLTVPALLWEPEMDLDDAAMADLKAVQDANPGAAYFIWEGDPLPGHIEKLKSAGLSVRPPRAAPQKS
jgi:zinc transport system substrate-binding protein